MSTWPPSVRRCLLSSVSSAVKQLELFNSIQFNSKHSQQINERLRKQWSQLFIFIASFINSIQLLYIPFLLFQAHEDPGSTLHGYLSKILARSCQDLGKILAKILPRYWQELQDVMVRSYQESHVPKKTFL